MSGIGVARYVRAVCTLLGHVHGHTAHAGSAPRSPRLAEGKLRVWCACSCGDMLELTVESEEVRGGIEDAWSRVHHGAGHGQILASDAERAWADVEHHARTIAARMGAAS